MERVQKTLFISCFVLFLFSMLIKPAYFQKKWRVPSEFRISESLPETPTSLAQWVGAAAQIELWFEDRITLRAALLQTQRRIDYHLLNVPPSRKVILGTKKPWKFLYSTYYNPGKVWAEVQATKWLHFFLKLNRIIKKSKVPLIVMIVPNKATIYPEYLPRVFHPRIESIRDEIKRRAKGHGIPFLDVVPVLQAEKKLAHTVFHYSDTHWNAYGIEVSFNRLMSEIHRYGGTKFNGVKLKHRKRLDYGDLDRMMGLKLAPSQVYSFSKAGMQIPKRVNRGNKLFKIYGGFGKSSAPSLAGWTDSFLFKMAGLLADSLSNMQIRRAMKVVDIDKVLRLSSDVIIFEVVERYLINDPPRIKNSDRASL